MDLVTKNTPKKQHYVPQFLLRNFAIENTEKLFTFNKQEGRSFPTNVQDSASENGFYNIKLSNKKYTLEYKLGNLEVMASQVISKACEAESVSDFSEDEHKILCFFVANLLLRVKRLRMFTSQVNTELVGVLRKVGIESHEVVGFNELNKDEIKFQHINFLNKELLNLANKFGDKAIGLLRAPQNCSFIISDNPVVMHCYKPNQFNSRGVSVPSVEIFLPISKKLCISFLCMDFYYELIEKVAFSNENLVHNLSYEKSLIESIQTGEASIITENQVEVVNSLQIMDSWSYIYNDSDNFDFVKDLIK